MILFKDDWHKYPEAIADIETNNKSFVRFSGLLKSMGIKNHLFPLALHNKKLQGVDPYDKNLTAEQIKDIIVEVKINFWYFIREIAKAPSTSGSENIPFVANRGNIALYWSFFTHCVICLEQIRQTGKSFSTDVLMSYFLDIRCQNTLINLLTKDIKVRTQNIERLRNIIKLFPQYMMFLKENGSDKDIFNTEALSIKALNNKYIGHVPQKSVTDAINQGRGLTSPIFHIDEVPFITNIKYSLPAALAAGGFARNIAAKKGEPYGTILTTTAGRTSTESGEYVFNLFKQCALWTEKFYDTKDEEDLHKVVRKQSSGGKLRIYAPFSHRQLGYTDEWLKKTIEDAMAENTPDQIRMDFFGEWINDSADNPLDENTLNKIRKSLTTDPFVKIDKEGYVTRWYIKENEIYKLKTHPCLILGADTSEAIGNDDICILLRDGITGATIATGKYNKTNIIDLSIWLSNLFIEFPNMVMIMERKSTGIVMLDYIAKFLENNNINPFKRLFNMVVNNREEEPSRYEHLISSNPVKERLYTKYKKFFGYNTTGSGLTSRNALYVNTFMHATKYTGHLIKDKTLIDQIGLLTIKNGRIDHSENSHDDMIIAWLLTHWFLLNAKGLDYYGINSNLILSEIPQNKEELKNVDKKEIIENKIDSFYKKKLNILLDKFKNNNNDIYSSRLELEIKYLLKKIREETTGFNFEAIMNELEKIKKTKNNKRK